MDETLNTPVEDALRNAFDFRWQVFFNPFFDVSFVTEKREREKREREKREGINRRRIALRSLLVYLNSIRMREEHSCLEKYCK